MPESFWQAAVVSPACAGMIPVLVAFSISDLREPRMRGDDPGLFAIDDNRDA